MLTFYTIREATLSPVPLEEARRNAGALVWVDLFEPSAEEEKAVEALFNAEIPTREEMHEIELSSRLYQENGGVYATATLVTKADTLEPEIHAVTFILIQNALITVRYSDPRPFRVFRNRTDKITPDYHGSTVLVELLESISDRLADILENIGHALDELNRTIFYKKMQQSSVKTRPQLDFEGMLQQIGRHGDLISKSRESLVTVSRLCGFISQSSYYKAGSDEYARLNEQMRDIAALSDHASFLSNRINFLLDATLGMIGIEQNAVIKIFSIAAVMFLPPTLIASIYGMNFRFVPEFNWHWGFPAALVVMLLSSYLPYKYFKRRGWL